MKQVSFLFFALFLFVFLAAMPICAQEQPESRTVTIRSSEINSGVVILAARDGKNSFDLHCNQGMTGCAVLQPGNYLMLRLPKNRGMYQCVNVELYRNTSSPELGEKIGQYCLVEEK